MVFTAKDYEGLGVFYLGQRYDATRGRPSDELVLYPSRQLTTHGAVIGMTGSGKTGLSIAMLEEALIDGIPVIAIDPKGDLSNLLLNFPNLNAQDFVPWVDAAAAEREGVSVETLAQREAEKWRAGLLQSGQDGARIARLRDACDMAIYTPGSNAGRPLTLLRSLAAPSDSVLGDIELLSERVQGAVSALLSLVGVDADPLRSREHILLCQIVQQAWSARQSLALPELIRSVQNPGFTQIGVFELDTFFPAKERLTLAMTLNNLLAAPGAQHLAHGEPMDIQRLFYTEAGRPRLSVISISHLSDAQRMYLVTTLLGEVLSWVRTQPGTTSLRALLYFDEVFGYFPPTAEPPSKRPMLTLLKQARAFGLGVLLATQNPVDIDYKGLANCGSWFIGRLQTERDKARVLDGLEGASSAAGKSFDRAQMEQTLSSLGQRVFLVNSVHEQAPFLLQTRFTLSYLRGPITRDEVRRLTARETPAPPAVAPIGSAGSYASGVAPTLPMQITPPVAPERPKPPEEAAELFFPVPGKLAEADYSPALYGRAKLHYVDKRAEIDEWRTVELLLPITAADPSWETAEKIALPSVSREPLPGSRFAPLRAFFHDPKTYAGLRKSLAQHVYQSAPLIQLQCKALKLVSAPGEAPGDFRAKLTARAREARDEAIEALREDCSEELAKLNDRLAKLEAKLAREKGKANAQMLDVAFSAGAGLLGALFGNKPVSATNVRRARSAARSASRAQRDRRDVQQTEETREQLQDEIRELDQQFREGCDQIHKTWDPAALEVEEKRISPRKSDIVVEAVRLAWLGV